MLKQVADTFGEWAQSGRGDSMAEGHWPRTEQIIQKMDITAGMSCVDIGCGNGYAVRAMADLVGAEGKVYGIDLSPEMVDLAIRQTDAPQATFMSAQAHQLPFLTDSIDRILSIEMLYYAPDTLAVLKDWVRILRTGKEASAWVMVDFYKENPGSECWADLLKLPIQYYSEAEYQEMFTEAGFTAVTTQRIYDPRPVTAEDEAGFKPGWGYNTIDDVKRFRTEIGSLLITGKI